MFFVPDDFLVPVSAEWDDWRLMALSVSYASSDFAAVTKSAGRIRHVSVPDNVWPAVDFRQPENLDDIQRHQAEFSTREAFTYSLIGRVVDDYLGCLYIKRVKSCLDVDFRRHWFDAQAFLWLAEEFYTVERDATMGSALENWLTSAWPFRCVAWPGRAINWNEWQQAATDAELSARLAVRATMHQLKTT
jgi:hypothetical protein